MSRDVVFLEICFLMKNSVSVLNLLEVVAMLDSLKYSKRFSIPVSKLIRWDSSELEMN